MRELVINGEVPGVAEKIDIFRDPVGHRPEHGIALADR